MTWVVLRSRRDAAVWLPSLLVFLVLLAGAAWAHAWTSAWLESLHETAASNPERAVDEAVRFIHFCEVALCAVAVAFGAFFYRFFQLGHRESRIPPSGWWSLGAWRALVGPEARRISRLGLFLSPLLAISTFAAVVLIECLVRTLLDGRPAV